MLCPTYSSINWGFSLHNSQTITPLPIPKSSLLQKPLSRKIPLNKTRELNSCSPLFYFDYISRSGLVTIWEFVIQSILDLTKTTMKTSWTTLSFLINRLWFITPGGTSGVRGCFLGQTRRKKKDIEWTVNRK